jgi:hypothetical protein
MLLSIYSYFLGVVQGFAQAVFLQMVAWLGPPSQAIVDTECKLHSKEIAEKAGVTTTMDRIDTDILYHILGFLTNDGSSIGRLALSSRGLYDRILSNDAEVFWKEAVFHRWKRSTPQPSSTTTTYRDLYVQRCKSDAHAIRLLKKMAVDLQAVLKLDESSGVIQDGNPKIGEAFEHPYWRALCYKKRGEYWDILKTTARKKGANKSVHEKLVGYLAARCLQNFRFLDLVKEWYQLTVTLEDTERRMGGRTIAKDEQLEQARLLEKCVLLICESQRNPMEVLEDDDADENVSCACEECREECNNNNSNNDDDNNSSRLLHSWGISTPRASRAVQAMDRITEVCRERMVGSATVTEQIRVVNDVFLSWYAFSGNTEDYYNYRNVLLDQVLATQQGMPLTLCLLYKCVCHRLGIPVDIIGLPGHIVLGFTEEGGTRYFLDVFNGGRTMSVDSCRRIVSAFGIPWNDAFLRPLRPSGVLQRIFNNLRNCHEKAMARNNGNGAVKANELFCSDLQFQHCILGRIQRIDSDISWAIGEHLERDLPPVLSPDLLRVYHLLSRTRPREVECAMHKNIFLELTSYAGFDFGN